MQSRDFGAAMAFLIMVAPLARGQESKEAPSKPSYAQDTPEAAFKSFMAAMMLGDEPALRRLTLDVDDFEWLLKGERLKVEQTEEFRKSFEKMALTRLKVGDEVKLPNGRVLKITEDQVGDDRAVLKPLLQPLPTMVRRVDGLWKVDARPIIAARKAADAARRRAEEAKKKAGA